MHKMHKICASAPRFVRGPAINPRARYQSELYIQLNSELLTSKDEAIRRFSSFKSLGLHCMTKKYGSESIPPAFINGTRRHFDKRHDALPTPNQRFFGLQIRPN